MEFIGVLIDPKCIRKGDNEKGHWERKTYLVEEESAFYPQKMAFEVTDGETGRYAKWDMLVGKRVRVKFGCLAIPIDKAGDKRYYNNLKAFAIEEA